MRRLLKGIYDQFNASTLAAEYKLHYALAPQETEPPYITFRLITDSTDSDFDCNWWESCVVQISAWSTADSSIEALEMNRKIRVVFDDATLTVPEWFFIHMLPTVGNLVDDPDGGWHYAQDYRVEIVTP